LAFPPSDLLVFSGDGDLPLGRLILALRCMIILLGWCGA